MLYAICWAEVSHIMACWCENTPRISSIPMFFFCDVIQLHEIVCLHQVNSSLQLFQKRLSSLLCLANLLNNSTNPTKSHIPWELLPPLYPKTVSTPCSTSMLKMTWPDIFFANPQGSRPIWQPFGNLASPPVSSRSEATWELKLLCLPQDLRHRDEMVEMVTKSEKNSPWRKIEIQTQRIYHILFSDLFLASTQHLSSSQSLQIEMDKLTGPSNRQIPIHNDCFKKKGMPGMQGIHLNHQMFERCQKKFYNVSRNTIIPKTAKDSAWHLLTALDLSTNLVTCSE